MKLIGQYDSPFVRRVAVALQIYGIVYDHVPWSTFGDGDLVARHNPLKRVPALVLDDGEVLIESGAILDYLDERVGPDRALLPLSGAARRAALRRIALMTGAADKAVSFFYAKLFSAALAPDFVSRCEGQIRTALAAIDRECGARVGLHASHVSFAKPILTFSILKRFPHYPAIAPEQRHSRSFRPSNRHSPRPRASDQALVFRNRARSSSAKPQRHITTP